MSRVTAPWSGRLVLVVDRLAAGGKERVVAHLARTWNRHIGPVRVVTLRDAGPFGQQLIEQGIAVTSLDSRQGPDPVAVRRLARLLTVARPAVINVHDRSSLPYVATANLLGPTASMVFTAHGLLGDAPARARLSERLALRACRAMTAVSPHVASRYAHLLHWPGEVTIVPNGIEPIRTRSADRLAVRSELGIAADTPLLLAVGNIKPEKSYDDLLDAAARLAERGSGAFHLAVAGDAADGTLAEILQRRSEQPDLAGRVSWLGSRDDVERLYGAADVFVLPSRTEGLPMALLEAMSAGLAVVASAVGDVPNVLAGQAGLLTPPGQPDALADVLAALLADPARRADLAGRAVTRIEQHYTAEVMTNRYADVFRRAARPGCAARPAMQMIGPLSPLQGGMVSVADRLARSNLARRYDLRLIQSGKTTPPGRSILRGMAAQAGLVVRVARATLAARRPIVHIHTCSGLTFWRDALLMLAARLTGACGVWHVHGGRFGEFATTGGPVRRAALGGALRLGGRIIVLTGAMRRQLAELIEPGRLATLPNGVVLSDRPATRSGRGPCRFLMLGTLSPAKGTEDLIDAAALLRDRGLACIIDIAGGETAPGQHAALEERITQAGLEEVVRLRGMLDEAARDDALAEADCFVLPSHSEALPMAVLEAMAAGLAVIATTVGALGEVVVEGQTGRLVPPREPAALADAMQALAEDPAARSRLGQAGRARIAEHYSLSNMVERLDALYRHCRKGPL